MVLNELGSRIGAALAAMSNATVIDEAVLDTCLKAICTALLQADVNVKLVMGLRSNVKKRVNIADVPAGLNVRRLIEKAVYDEMVSMLDSGIDPKTQELKKGKPNVVMFVGLQGCGKTTTCTKYAYHFKRKGFKPALVCADTFRAGAFDQLKQNATKAAIPFYGSYQETDPAVIAAQGVDRFKAESRDLIIVDTSGRHKQSEALFEEMRAVAAGVAPDLVIFVMDSSIGQAAHDQAAAFRESVDVGQVIVTKMDGHAKGGGALSAVAATKSPISFIGTGEHMHEFETFETGKFVSRLLGKGDWNSFIERVQDAVPDEDQPELMDKISRGQFTMRIMYEQFANITKMGPMSQVMSMIPGFSNALMPPGHEKESGAKIKRYMCIMDSMTNAELDASDPKLFTASRVTRIARGSGHAIPEVLALLEEHKRLAKMFQGAMKGMKGMPKGGKGGRGGPQVNMDPAQMAKMLPPHMLQQMGGVQAIQQMMKQMEGIK
jgi:signal recognition particle subunit SRP54